MSGGSVFANAIPSPQEGYARGLFGDAAGKTLGFTPRGLSRGAGLALALHDARLTLSR